MPQHTIPIPARTALPTRNAPHAPHHRHPDIILHIAVREIAIRAKGAVAEQVVVVAEFFFGVGLDAVDVGPACGAGGWERGVDALGVGV